MDVSLYVDPQSMGLFAMTIEPQELTISSLKDMASLQWQVTFKSPTAWDITQYGVECAKLSSSAK